MNEQLDQMKAQMVEALKLEGLPVEKQDALIEKIGEALMKRLFLETIEKLGAEGTKEYEALLERGAEAEEIDTFLEQKIPGYHIFVREVVDGFREEMQRNIELT